jgi:hypothetical protein
MYFVKLTWLTVLEMLYKAFLGADLKTYAFLPVLFYVETLAHVCV